MIHVIATVELQPGKRERFLAVLHGNVPRVLAEDGCMEYGPAVDVSTGIGTQLPLRADVVTIIEKWRDLPALHAHLAAPHMTAYRADVKDLVVRVTLQVLQPA